MSQTILGISISIREKTEKNLNRTFGTKNPR